MSDVDRELLRAAIITNKRTGIPIHCHILEAPLAEQVMDLLEREEAGFGKFLWAHTLKDRNDAVIDRARKLGIWLGLDIIRKDTFEDYMNFIKEAIAGGFENRILLSQDYDFYEESSINGVNHPCASFFTDFIPYCIACGIPSEILETIVSKNPAEFYDF